MVLNLLRQRFKLYHEKSKFNKAEKKKNQETKMVDSSYLEQTRQRVPTSHTKDPERK